MKLIFAGISSTTSLNFSNYLFNCTRNKRCQREYFIPLRKIEDLYFFADLPGQPEAVQTSIIDPCCVQVDSSDGSFSDDFSDDFDIGGDVGYPCPTSIVFDKYVVGTTPANQWYGVFQTTANNPPFRQFFFRFIFTINSVEYVYYSQLYELEVCAPLLWLRGCYPNEPKGSSAWDCNGIYYGFPTGATILGDGNFRYFHQAFVRRGTLIDTTAKLALSLFISKRTYKSILTREKTLEFELVPAFYKDVLLGIFTRGQVQIEGVEYVLTEEQNWKVLDFDSKLWQLDTLLHEECKNFFGCAPADCVLPMLKVPCINNIDQDVWSYNEGEYTQNFAGPTNAGDYISWELLDTNRILLYSGDITAPPWTFVLEPSAGINPNINCYYLRWKVICLQSESDWKENKFGNCFPVDLSNELTGTFAMSAYCGPGSNQCSAQGNPKYRLRFNVPLPFDLVISFAALYDPRNGSGSYQAIGTDIIPAGHPDKALFDTWNYGPSFQYTIPAGTQDWLSPLVNAPDPTFPSVNYGPIVFPQCNGDWGTHEQYKIYFKITSPINTTLDLSVVYDVPSPYNVIGGSIQVVQQIV